MTHLQTLRLHDGPDYSTRVDITAMTHHTFFSQIEITVCADTNNMYDRLPYLMIYSIHTLSRAIANIIESVIRGIVAFMMCYYVVSQPSFITSLLLSTD